MSKENEMVETIEDIRREYALAYSRTIPFGESAKKRTTETDEEYADRWYRGYAKDMAKIAVFAQVALTSLAEGKNAETARTLVHYEIRGQGSMVVEVLLDNIQPLRSVLLSDPVDEATFKRTMELIVQAFGESPA